MLTPLGVSVFDNAFPEHAAALEFLENCDGWNRSIVADGVVSERRTSDTLFFPFIGFAIPEIIFMMNKCVWTHLDAYAKHWNFTFEMVENVSIQRYDALMNQHYDVHCDASTQMPRSVSAVLYLNDVAGGGTYFPAFDFEVQPKAGRLAIFPSNFIYAHEARPPETGVKYAAAYWAR